MEAVGSRIRGFLSKMLRKHEILDDSDLFALGGVNSLFAMQLVLFLEKEFEIRVEKSDLEINNFRTINSMVKFIDQKRAQVSMPLI